MLNKIREKFVSNEFKKNALCVLHAFLGVPERGLKKSVLQPFYNVYEHAVSWYNIHEIKKEVQK